MTVPANPASVLAFVVLCFALSPAWVGVGGRSLFALSILLCGVRLRRGSGILFPPQMCGSQIVSDALAAPHLWMRLGCSVVGFFSFCLIGACIGRCSIRLAAVVLCFVSLSRLCPFLFVVLLSRSFFGLRLRSSESCAKLPLINLCLQLLLQCKGPFALKR